MSFSRAVLVTGALVSAAVWLIAAELPWPARSMSAVLLGILPASTVLQARAIARLGEEQLPARNRMYASTIIGLWGLAIAASIAATESGFTPQMLGIVPTTRTTFWLWVCFAITATAALVVAFKAFGIEETPTLHYLIPRSATEKLTFVGVSVTAGICEELVFRGFLIAALHVATGSVLVATLVAAAAFGVSHAHQNARGGLRAGLLGLVMSVPLLVTGSVYPAVAAHAAVDLVAGLWLSKWLLKS